MHFHFHFHFCSSIIRLHLCQPEAAPASQSFTICKLSTYNSAPFLDCCLFALARPFTHRHHSTPILLVLFTTIRYGNETIKMHTLFSYTPLLSLPLLHTHTHTTFLGIAIHLFTKEDLSPLTRPRLLFPTFWSFYFPPLFLFSTLSHFNVLGGLVWLGRKEQEGPATWRGVWKETACNGTVAFGVSASKERLTVHITLERRAAACMFSTAPHEH